MEKEGIYGSFRRTEIPESRHTKLKIPKSQSYTCEHVYHNKEVENSRQKQQLISCITVICGST